MSQIPPPLPVYQPTTLNPYADASTRKIAAGICAIVIGALGIHKFILGYTTAGIITLCVTFLTCGLAAPVMHIIGLIEGVIYLTKTDEAFHATYIANHREWF